jgi:hypothetical protein
MKKLLAIFALIFLAPLIASAQADGGFSRQGIFGCSRNAAALSGSVGAFSATGGVYVPVADYTVELNTGTLVYLECVLRGIVDRESESANSADINKRVQFITAGNNGNAYFLTQPSKEYLNASDQRELASLKDETLVGAMDPKFAANVQRAAAQSYMQETRNRESALDCPSDPNASDLDTILAMRNPACYDIGAYNIYTNLIRSDVAQCLQYVKDELNWGRGFYAVVQGDICDGGTIQTPSVYVEEEGLQAVTSGFRRVESANNVDQMVGALYAGLGTQALTGSGGFLTGLTTAIGNSPSYLSQMTAESSAGLRNAAANAALQVLASARAVEAQYNQVVSNMANSLTSSIGQLRSAENQCWGLIEYNTTTLHVCTAAPVGNSCTDAAGNTLKIATSTQFSQAVIDAQITPAANQVVTNVQKSQAALTLIDQLIGGVTNTTSLDAQRLALVQLDQLVSQGKLHVQADVTAVQQQQSAVSDSMTQLVTQTKTLWADSATLDVNSGSGWCNVNSQSVIDFWDSKWR